MLQCTQGAPRCVCGGGGRLLESTLCTPHIASLAVCSTQGCAIFRQQKGSRRFGPAVIMCGSSNDCKSVYSAVCWCVVCL